MLRPLPRGAHAAPLPRVDRRASSRSRRSARATCCSPASSPRASTARPFDEALRQGVGCAAASVLELGAGPLRPARGGAARVERRARRASADLPLERTSARMRAEPSRSPPTRAGGPRARARPARRRARERAWTAWRRDVDGADRAADAEDDRAGRLRRATGSSSFGTGTEPASVAGRARYQAMRSPSGVRSSVASTCGVRAIATGAPCGTALAIRCRSRRRRSRSAGRRLRAAGPSLPSAAGRDVRDRARRRRDLDAPAASVPGTSFGSWRPAIR